MATVTAAMALIDRSEATAHMRSRVKWSALAPSGDSDCRLHREVGGLGRLVFDLACQIETLLEIWPLDQEATLKCEVGVRIAIAELVAAVRFGDKHIQTVPPDIVT